MCVCVCVCWVGGWLGGGGSIGVRGRVLALVHVNNMFDMSFGVCNLVSWYL